MNGQTPYDLRPLEVFWPNDYFSLFPFGHGLSYTSFEYTDLKVATSNVNYNDGVQVSVKVTNKGLKAGKETVIYTKKLKFNYTVSITSLQIIN